MAPSSELEKYRHFMGPAEMHKSVNELVGILTGIAADGLIDADELSEMQNWYELHRHLINRHPFNEIIPAIDSALADDILEIEEAKDLIWLCQQVSGDKYYDFITASIQQLHGILHGIMANNILVDSELEELLGWLEDHSGLRGTYPFDEIYSLLATVTEGGTVMDAQRNQLRAFFSEFIDTRESVSIHETEMAALRETYSIQGICARNPEVDIVDHTFCFTGMSCRATRVKIAAQIESAGGIFKENVVRATDYLVVGADGNPCWAFSCYGRKVEAAMSLRKKGVHIVLLNEYDFWDALDEVNR